MSCRKESGWNTRMCQRIWVHDFDVIFVHLNDPVIEVHERCVLSGDRFPNERVARTHNPEVIEVAEPLRMSQKHDRTLENSEAKFPRLSLDPNLGNSATDAQASELGRKDVYVLTSLEISNFGPRSITRTILLQFVWKPSSGIDIEPTRFLNLGEDSFHGLPIRIAELAPARDCEQSFGTFWYRDPILIWPELAQFHIRK